MITVEDGSVAKLVELAWNVEGRHGGNFARSLTLIGYLGKELACLLGGNNNRWMRWPQNSVESSRPSHR